MAKRADAYQKLIDSDQAVAGMKGLVDVRTEWMKRAIMAGESIGFESRDVTTKPKDTDLIEEVIDRYEPHVPSEPGDMSLSATYPGRRCPDRSAIGIITRTRGGVR